MGGKEHLLLSCGAGEEPASTVVSEAGHRAFVSSCCHSLGEATSPPKHPTPLSPPVLVGLLLPPAGQNL